MKVLNFFREGMNWDEKIHGGLVRALNQGNIAKAVDIFQQNFKNADDLVKFPSILAALEKTMIACFQPVEQSSGGKDFHILAIPRATQLRQVFLNGTRPEFKKILASPELAAAVRSFIVRQLKQGDYDSIERAIRAKSFLVEHMDVLGDRELRRSLLIALMKNFTNSERLYKQNIDKIGRGFLSGHEEFFESVAAKVVEFFRKRGDEIRAREIEQVYLGNPDVASKKSSSKNIA
ncbi:MAG TPA: hypothetical protein PLB38_00235 [bacterium]|nr:hypothetical protein [bacterium]